MVLEKIAFLNELGSEIKTGKVKYSSGQHASKKSAPGLHLPNAHPEVTSKHSLEKSTIYDSLFHVRKIMLLKEEKRPFAVARH